MALGTQFRLDGTLMGTVYRAIVIESSNGNMQIA